jgi:RNA ligase
MAAPMLYAVRAAVSAKYPRSFHLPWSPGGTSDDKRLRDVSALVGAEIVITEKCDGSNLTYTRSSVFSRSHSGPPGHPSFHIAKATHARIAHLLSDGVSVFCEYCYAVHSIAYEALPSYSLVFGVRDDVEGIWWDWDMTVMQAEALGLPTVPLLFRGVVSTEDELRSLTASLAREPSALGGPREGVVVRRAGQFSDSEFSRSLGKWVRKDHVQTDEHWMHQAIVPQKLAERT